MSTRFNRQNIDRKTNKPSVKRTEGLGPDRVLNRSEQIRRDDDVFRTPKRTVYDIDYAIKWFIENEIQPQITFQQELVKVPVIFANGEKWDNVQRLGYIRDEKGMLQSPLVMIKRSSIAERDTLKHLDQNRTAAGIQRVYRNRYNKRNRYEDRLFPMPINQPENSQEFLLVDIPRYVTISYELMMWCDFTTQINDLVDQFMPYARMAWGNEANRFVTYYGGVTFETINTVGEDRLVRANLPITVDGTLLAGQEFRRSTLQKMYSVKKVRFDTVVDTSIFDTTTVPLSILQTSVGTIFINDTTSIQITPAIMSYLTNLTDQQATVINPTTAEISHPVAINPVTLGFASKNEFDVYINGQYIDKNVYTWSPGDTLPNTIIFDTGLLGYNLDANFVIVVNGRWA